MTTNAELIDPGSPYVGYRYAAAPRNVYWEMTIACDLACRHCRADAIAQRDADELSTEEAQALMRDVKSMGSLLILTGGDPMKRPDLFDLMGYAREIRLPLAITPSTTPTLTEEAVHRFKELGAVAVGISLDGPGPEVHDAFRCVDGTFASSQRALGWCRDAHLPVQVNTTVTRETLPHLPRLYELLLEHSPPVKRWSLFLLVPVGRGLQLGMPDANEVEELCGWVYETSRDAPFHMNMIEAPHYRRYWVQQRLAEGMSEADVRRLALRMGFGVRDGNGIVFVSHQGEIYPAGFLPILLGNVREHQLSEVYRSSPELGQLRDMNQLSGKCGRCEYRWLCGGSRARAFGMTGDAMGSDPVCAYEPALETVAV